MSARSWVVAIVVVILLIALIAFGRGRDRVRRFGELPRGVEMARAA